MRAAWLFATAITLWGWQARAQDPAAAGALFDRGLADMQAGNFERGCPALDDSYRLDPRPGTLFTLAECEAKWGHIARAVTHYQDYLARFEQMPIEQRAGQRGREKIAAAQVAALKPELPMLTVHVAAGAPNGTTVTRDGHELGASALDVALPVDPGEHVIAIVAPFGGRSEQRVTIGRGENKSIELTVPAAPVVAPPLVEPSPAHEAQPSARPTPPETPISHRGWTVATFVVAGVALGLGGVMGAMTLYEKSIIDANCNGTICNATGKSAADTAQVLGGVSTAGFVAFGVATAIGVVLVLTEPKRARNVAFGPGGAGLAW